LKTAEEKWNSLFKKYTEALPTSGRQFLQELITYKMAPDTTIQEAWGKLQSLKDKVIMTNPDLKSAFSTKQVFQLLLQSLPTEYSVIRDSIDAIGGIDSEIGLRRLEDKEAQLKAVDIALVARKQDKRRGRSSSGSPGRASSPKKDRRLRCFICNESHRMRDCELLDEVRAYASRQVAKKRGANISDAKYSKRSKKHRGYTADVETDTEDTDSDEDYAEETAALSKDVASKIPRSEWVADSGASSHMTDQLRLFSGPLNRIKRRQIKVGGGKLYADYCGTVTMRDHGGNSVLLSSVLYVPNLGVNLLSGRRMCEKGLQGSFDQQSLYMHDKFGKEMLKAHERGGVYIVEKIAKGLDEFALFSAMRHDSTSSMNIDTAFPSVDTGNSSMNAANESAIVNEVDYSQPSVKTYKLWHRRFAHLGPAKLRDLHKVTTLKKPIPIVHDQENVCEVCALTKFNNRKGHEISEHKAAILNLISVDICGPLPLSRDGYAYFLEIVDNHSRKTWTIPLKRREDAPEALRKWRLKVELQSGSQVLSVRSDNGTELKATIDEWCSSLGIAPQYTVPYMSIQNGVAERAIRTTENSIRAMIKEAELPIEFWAEAAETDSYLRNRTATGPVIDGKLTTPEEAFTGTKPSIDHIRVWGCKCYSYVDPKSLPVDGRRDKFMDRGRVGVFVEYVDETIKQFRLWAPDLGRVIRSHAIKFDESEKGSSIDLKLRKQTANVLPERRPVGRPRREVTQDVTLTTSASAPVSTQNDLPSDKRTIDNELTAVNLEHIDSPTNMDPSTNASRDQNDFSHSGSIDHMKAKVPETIDAPKMAETFLHVAIPKRPRDDDDHDLEERTTKRSRAALLALLACEDLNESQDSITSSMSVSQAMIATALMAEDTASTRMNISTPVTYREAIEDPVWGELWKKAIDAELVALAANGTWEEVEPPRGANIVTSKWVFKAKLHVDGSLDKLKARLVARGFSQMHGIDYEDTFAPTVKFDTLRIFMALTALENLECHQVDVNNAFTESFLKEEIYMSPPAGVTIAPGRVLRVLRSLYGLKQAARDWYESCVKELKKLGFHQCPADPCLLLMHSDRSLMLLLYVDDISISGRSLADIDWFKNAFGSIFKVKDLGEMKKILGIRITRNRPERTLRMDQTHYLEEVLKRLQMRADKHNPTEFPMNGYDSLRPAGPQDQRISQRDYQHAIGSLMYAAIHTRPDISFAIGRLSQYLSDPAKHHGHALKALLRYVRSTVDLGIVYGISGSSNLIGYSDSDYASDKLDRKSILGYCYMLGEGPVSWISRKQKSVATSTTEAEYMALSTCAKEGLWITQLLKDMKMNKYLGDNKHRVDIKENSVHEISSPIQLMGDNQAALTLVKDAHIHERSKHIDVAYHHVRDLHTKNQIRVSFVPSQDMIADGFTKPLPKQSFKRFVDQLGLKSSGSQ